MLVLTDYVEKFLCNKFDNMQCLRPCLKNFDLTSVLELLPMLRNLRNLHSSSSLPQFAVTVNNSRRSKNNSFDGRISKNLH